MTSQSIDRAGLTARLQRLSGVVLLSSLVLLGACDSLLTVDNPGRVPSEDLDAPALAPVLEAAAIQQAQCAFVQYALTGGMLAGEYISSNGFVDNHIWEWRGIVEIKGAPGACTASRTATSLGFYTPLQQARFQLDDAAKRFEGFTDAQVPNRQLYLAEMRAYAGYTYTLLAEGMCDMAIDNGPKMTGAEVLAIAEARFTSAITVATALSAASTTTAAKNAAESLKNMALVGRARVRLDLANLAGAATDAALVPAGFVRNAEFSESTLSRENRIYNLTVRGDYLSTGPDYRNLTVNGVADPRVKVTNTGRTSGLDNVTPIWQQQKFTGSAAVAFPIASYIEAQLILAEASGGQVALDAINRVRAVAGVAALAGPPAADMVPVVLEERRRQLFSEGQRYSDLLRKKIPFSPAAGTVNRKGQTVSSLTCVPLPDVETRNNPNFK